MKGRRSKFWRRKHVISLFLPSLGEIRLGDFGLLVLYRIVYFGVVFDLVFQICINSRTYVFSNSYPSLIEFMASRSGTDFQPAGGRIMMTALKAKKIEIQKRVESGEIFMTAIGRSHDEIVFSRTHICNTYLVTTDDDISWQLTPKNNNDNNNRNNRYDNRFGASVKSPWYPYTMQNVTQKFIHCELASSVYAPTSTQAGHFVEIFNQIRTRIQEILGPWTTTRRNWPRTLK